MRTFLEKLCKGKGIHVAPSIPDKKLNNAILSYAPDVDPDKVVLLHDDTVFGSAAEGLIVTEDGLYGKDLDGELKFNKFKKIKSVVIDKGLLYHTLLVNGKTFIDITQPDYAACLLLAEFIERVASEGPGVIEVLKEEAGPPDTISEKINEGLEKAGSVAWKVIGGIFVLILLMVGITTVLEEMEPDTDGDYVKDHEDCAPEDPSISTTKHYDRDCDGISDSEDCAPSDPKINSSKYEDSDCDGVEDKLDCEEYDKSIRTTRATDKDCDGTPDDVDCAPDDRYSSADKTTDSDCDGVLNSVDCDPNNKDVASAKSEDSDCDGVVDANDCDPSDPGLATSKYNDEDCDGVNNDEDCARDNPKVRTKKGEDRNCDGVNDADEVKYPAPCSGLDMSIHVKVKKDEERCVPKFSALVLLAGGQKFPGMPYGYSDDNELSMLLSPNKVAYEESSLTSSERNAITRKVKQRVYYKTMDAGVYCDTSFVWANGKLSSKCDIGSADLYTGSAPSVKKTQDCETIEGCTIDDFCSSHDDCDGWFCGCPQSRCTIWGVCTRCGGDRICDDPIYSVKTKDWKLSTKVKGDEGKSRVSNMADNMSDYQLLIGFKLTSAWRRIATERKCDYNWDDKYVCEREVANNTGYYGRMTPLHASFIKCTVDECTVQNALELTDLQNGSFSVVMTNGAHSATVSCKRGECTARKK